MAHDVFISYASSDKAVADAVCAQLESVHRIRCWIAPRDVTPGASWAQSIIEALDDSKVMVLIFSSKANASMQIEREVERAVHKGINIIPLRIEDTLPTKTLEYFISAPHWLDAMSAPLERHIAKLAASVKALLAKQTPARPLEGAALATPEVAHAPGAAGAPAAARAKLESRGAASAPSSRSRWLIPAAVVVLVIMGIGAFAVRQRGAAPEAESAASATAAAPSAPTAAGAPLQEPASTTAATPTPAAGANPTPPTASTAPPVAAPASATSTAAAATATPGTAAAARPAARGSARTPNLVLDLNENLPDDGSIRVDVDGVQRWTEKLTQETKGSSLVLAKGPHEVTVTLLRPSGEVRETRSTKLEADPAVTSTVRVRLSRFKRNLELEVVAPRPEPTAVAPAPASAKEPARGTTAAKPAPATR